MGFGLIGGANIGIITGLIGNGLSALNLAMGAGFGMLIGIVVGAIMDFNKNKK